MIVLVTGATSGFGAAIARRFAGDGHKIVAAGRRLERLETLRAELGEDLVLPLALDVRDTDAVASVLTSLPAAFSEIDVLVNNAGLALGLATAQDADLTAWDTMVDTNIKGLIHMTRAILPGMIARERGHVVNIGSVSATNPYRGGNVYGSTKAFVRQFSFNLRADLQGTPIRVTDVAPGFSSGSEFSAVRFGDAARAAKLYEDADPLLPEDIADAVHWAVTRPARVNVNVLEVMPVCQSFSPLTITRKPAGE